MADGIIIHGNADLVCVPQGSPALPERDLFPELDDLLDVELILVSHAYNARLRSIPRPVAPVPLP